MLPLIKVDPYAGDVPDSSDLRRFRLDQETWEAYGELVGNGARSADIKAYIAWWREHPDTPRRGKRRLRAKKPFVKKDEPSAKSES